ncbi:MAG: DUF5103 domain-containing protein [Ignavibacteriae bacterium]|nr:MAG: DUF5103 domain-containing protein [Ignavibacteriota bacterium]
MSNSINRMKTILLTLLVFLAAASCIAQTIYSERIKGIRVNGSDQANFPIVLLDSHPVTILFDIDGTRPENYRIKIFHCDKDWHVTPSTFINDEFRNYTTVQLPFEEVPNGVKYFRWTYSFTIPGITGMEALPYSGNYKVEIWNEEMTELLAEGKIFAVEKIEDSVLTISNRYLQSEISPRNQVNKAVLSFAVPPFQADNVNPFYANYVKTVDIYRNRELERSNRIDADARTTNTFIDGIGTNSFKFMIDNLQPGNEYRRIDLRDADLYPPFEMLRPRNGADMSRWMWQGNMDEDGTSVLAMGSRYADYVQFQFELGIPEGQTDKGIYVVGDFNGWKVDEKWRLQYDDGMKHYKLLCRLRRGAYDYQYVLNGNDWISLEGNDWRTTNVYTAFLYYHDVRFGGFDRILLSAQKKSPGGSSPNSN